MKKIPLIVSLTVNVLLVLAIFAVRLHYHKMIFRALYNTTMTEVRFHEKILTELQSENTYKVETIKIMLERNIRDRKESAAVWESAAERIRMR